MLQHCSSAGYPRGPDDCLGGNSDDVDAVQVKLVMVSQYPTAMGAVAAVPAHGSFLSMGWSRRWAP